MIPSELRSAAEYFATTDACTCDPESGVTNCMGCDVAAMARHILSTVRDDDGEPVTELDTLRAENASLRKQAETNHTLRAELAAAREELAQTPPTLEWLEKTLGVPTIIHTWKGINDCYEWRNAVRWYRGHLRCTDIHGVTLTTRAAVLAAVESKEA